jgi:hypothetical protein
MKSQPQKSQPQKIEGTNDYSYKGFTIGKYENANGGTRWMVLDGETEVAFDLFKLWAAVDYIDQH